MVIIHFLVCFFISALANVVVYHMLITIDIFCFIVDGAVLLVSYKMSSPTESLVKLSPLHQVPLLLPSTIHPLQTIPSLPRTCCLVWTLLLFNPSIWAQHSLLERHLAPSLLWSCTALFVGCAVSSFIICMYFALVGSSHCLLLHLLFVVFHVVVYSGSTYPFPNR